MFSRRDLFKIFGLGTAAGVASVVAEPIVRRAYSFVGGWARDWRYPEWDARHWGVVGDGVTDDTTALQRALDNHPYVSANNLSLLLSGPVRLTDRSEIAHCDIFFKNGSGQLAPFIIADGANVSLQHNRVDCNGSDYAIAFEGPESYVYPNGNLAFGAKEFMDGVPVDAPIQTRVIDRGS